MVIVYIGIAVGVLIVAILIFKALKSSPDEALFSGSRCKKCGSNMSGLTQCPKCEKRSPSFGV